MTWTSTLALFSAMAVLAAIPSISVLTVVTRSATAGFRHGFFTTMGIVVGDMIFIIIAIWGLSFFAAKAGGLFFLIKYLGGAYLMLLGIKLCRSQPSVTTTIEVANASLLSSFLTGLSITLADQKATLFYLGFFPVFLDISRISYLDTGIIITTNLVSVGGVKLVYAGLADQSRFLIDSKKSQFINIGAGCVMLAVGIFLVIKV